MADSLNFPSASTQHLDDHSVVEKPLVNGSGRSKLSPAQQRQLEADTRPDPLLPPSSSSKRPTESSNPPNLLSEGDFPTLGSPKSTPKPAVGSSWGVKRPTPITPSTLNGTNGRGSSTANSSRASTPAPTPRPPVIPGTRNLHSQNVTELVRFGKHQLQNPYAKDFGNVCERITKLTNVEKIVVTRMKVSEVVTFSITGRLENVIKARNRLQNEIGIKRVEKLYSPSSVLPYIIGKRGATLKNIQEMSGANVRVPKREEIESASVVVVEGEDEEELVEITIEGIDAAVTKAKEEITKIVDEKTSKKTEKLVNIPADYFLLIAGPNDVNIQEWEGPPERDVKIRIPNPHLSGADDHITLTGHRDLVAEVREKIEAKFQQLKATTAAVTFDVPRAQHRFLIGDRGNGLKDLLAETGCAVIVPPLCLEAGDSVVIRSERSKVGVGLEKVMERAADITLVTVDLTTFTGRDEDGIAHARNFYRYAKRQNLFAKLSSMYETVNLTTPRSTSILSDDPSFVFEIDGKDATQVHKVESSLQSLITSFPREKFSTIEIDPCLYGILIGKKGQGLQSLKDRFDVFCIFDDSDPETLLVYEGKGSPIPALTGVKDHIQTLASTTSDITEQSLNIPRKHHKLIVGPNGTTLNALIGDQSDRTTGTRIHVYVGGKSRDPEKQDDVVIVRGPSADVTRICKNITDHVAEAKHTEFITSHVEEFTIPETYSKNIIGRGGKRIQELRERFGVAIKVDEGKVHIQGVKKNAEEARKSIIQIVNELKDDTIQRLPIKNEHHGHLIGEKGILTGSVANIGANVRRLQERYSVRIHFPRRDDEEERNFLPDEEKPMNADEIVVRGPSKGVKSAVDELNALLEYRLQYSHTAEVKILARGRQRLLRNSGGVVYSLRQDPGHVRIDVPPRLSDETDDTIITIKIEGTESFVKKAVKEISALGDEIKGEKIRILTIDQKYHKGLIGPNGRTVQKLIVDAGGPEDRSVQARIVRFPRHGEDSDKIVLTGPPAVVDKIAEKILEFAARETIEVDVPGEKLSWIIGTGGKKRMELEAEFDVLIYVPQVNRGNDKDLEKVKITGMPEQNEKAKKAIQDIVKSGDGVVIQVPRRLHHRLSNEGRTKNQIRQRFQVHVSHDGAQIPQPPTSPVNGTLGRIDDEEETYSWHVVEDPTDSCGESIPWKLRGSNETNVQKAKEYLDGLISSIANQGNYTGYLGIPPEHHYLIIGKGGQRIGIVRDETGCTIDVPKRGDGNDTIVIRGSKDGIEKAREMIVETVRNGQYRSNGSGPQRRR